MQETVQAGLHRDGWEMFAACHPAHFSDKTQTKAQIYLISWKIVQKLTQIFQFYGWFIPGRFLCFPSCFWHNFVFIIS